MYGTPVSADIVYERSAAGLFTMVYSYDSESFFDVTSGTSYRAIVVKRWNVYFVSRDSVRVLIPSVERYGTACVMMFYEIFIWYDVLCVTFTYVGRIKVYAW